MLKRLMAVLVFVAMISIYGQAYAQEAKQSWFQKWMNRGKQAQTEEKAKKQTSTKEQAQTRQKAVAQKTAVQATEAGYTGDTEKTPTDVEALKSQEIERMRKLQELNNIQRSLDSIKKINEINRQRRSMEEINKINNVQRTVNELRRLNSTKK